MPEGDTLHRHAAELAPLLVGRTLLGAFEHGAPRPSLVGRAVRSVEARGKHLLIALSEGAVIHVHLGMNGRIWRKAASAVDPRRTTGAALILKTAEAAVVFWRPRTLEVLREAFVHAHPALARLGPDLLAPPPPTAEDVDGRDDDTATEADTADTSTTTQGTTTAAADAQLDAVVARARALQQGKAIADLLLDQRVASGIGNVYKSEVLFLERVDPFAPAAAVDDELLRRLYRRAATLLAQNLGPWRRTTTADLTRGQAPRRGMGRHHVYRRTRRPCWVCGTAIASRPQGPALRMTYFCPRCQVLPSGSGTGK